jgi:hypothetical protein
MPTVDVWDLMELYARRGVADWKAADSRLRKRAGECLAATQIAARDEDAIDTINTVYTGTNEKDLSFIPMPKPGKNPIERCFFLPIREKKADGSETLVLELLVLVARKDCLAFRFEPAHHHTSRHGYGHLQMNQKMLKGTIPIVGIPPWLPASYPAFPISTSDPLKTFLAMATAVHGYASGGLPDLLADIFQKASRASDSAAYVAELRLFLAGTIRWRVEPGWNGLKALTIEFRHWANRTIRRKRR